jgi:hypothetical protein
VHDAAANGNEVNTFQGAEISLSARRESTAARLGTGPSSFTAYKKERKNPSALFAGFLVSFVSSASARTVGIKGLAG